MKEGPTRSLAKFAAELTYDKIPASVIDHAKLCVLDTIACGLFGSHLPWVRIIVDLVLELGGPEESTVWGYDFKAPAPNASLANGTAVHSFELDDLHKTAIVHPGGVAIPAALAIAERVGGCDGKEFLTGVIAGYEVAIRIGIGVGTSHLQRGFHPTGTNGTFAAGASAGKILKLNTEQMIHDLGISGSQAAGLMASQYGAMVRQMHVGRAAQSGTYGALLAQRGYTGIINILEADYGGYCGAMAEESDMSQLTSGLGENFETEKVGFKPYAAGGSTHTAHEAVKSIMEKNHLTEKMVDQIVIRTTTATYYHTSWPYHPGTISQAQMNMHYVVAVTALERDIFIDQFTEEKVSDPRIVEYSRRVKVIPDPDLDKLGPEFRHAVIAEVRTFDGRTFTERVDTAKGGDKRPLTKEEVIQKYRILAGKRLSSNRVSGLEDVILNLEKVSDVREFARRLIS